MMLDYIKINFLLVASVVFGPLLAAYLSFYGDVYTLSKKYRILEYLGDEWELVFLFSLFWLGFYFMLTLLSTVKKLLNKPPKLEWWQTETIYQIFVKSFYDSSNNGSGDLNGIAKKLDYIKSIGMKAIWLTPIYPSSGRDGGYDITSFVKIDNMFGSMKDLDNLIQEVHKRGMYILLDFIPNHTSSEHKWFQESCKDNDPKNPYRDYYVWYPSQDKVNPPNNWKSCFGGSMWTYNETRQAWYLHQFLAEQPDLNMRCPAVRKELENVIQFWLEEKDVDGFRIDAVKHLFESANFEDEPLADPKKFKSIYDEDITYDDLVHLYSANQVETYKLLFEWRRMFDEIGKRTNRVKALIAEATYNVEDIGSYSLYNNEQSAHFPLNFQLCFLNNDANENLFKSTGVETKPLKDESDRSFKPNNLRNLIEEYFRYLPKNCWPNWEVGNHDQKRVATRIGRENVNLANALNLLMGGTAVVYYGEEIGMEDLDHEFLKFEDCQDERAKRLGPKKFMENSRDFARTPMQWNSSKNSGFSNADKTWLPLNPNYKKVNVEEQLKSEKSHLKIFKDLVQLRKAESFQWGTFKMVVVNDQIFSFVRKAYGFSVYLVVMNMSDSDAVCNLLINSDIAPRAYVAYYIAGTRDLGKENNDLETKYTLKAPVLTKNFPLKAHDCLILTWPSSE